MQLMALKKEHLSVTMSLLLCIMSQLIKLAVENKSEQVKLFRSMPCHEYVLYQGQYFTPASWERIYWQTSGAI